MGKTGKVYLVGAGPGDPGLLTLRAKEVLSEADAVLYDALIHPRILGFIPEKAKKIFRGHRLRKDAMDQEAINALLVKLAKQGLSVVRLKGGDPFVFGRGAEEAMELAKNRIPFEVVPGITAAVAVPAYAGIPVTHRPITSSFTVVTGHEGGVKAPVDWRGLAQNQGTLIFLMGFLNLSQIADRLLQAGKPPATPAAVIQWGTTGRQRAVKGTLKDIAETAKAAGLVPPATVVIGRVVGLMEGLQWYRRGPLSGLRVLVTRGRAQMQYLSDALSEKGAGVVEIPTIEIVPIPLTREPLDLLHEAGNYDWIVFSSINAVTLYMKALTQVIMDPRDMPRSKIACVGEATATALAVFGIRANLVPGDYRQEELIKAFARVPLKGKRFLLARAKENRDTLEHFLRKNGAQVDPLELYENRVPPGTQVKLKALFEKEGGVDLLTFASSSAVDHFYRLFTPSQRKEWLSNLPAAVMGPVTAAAVKKWGVKEILLPKKFTVPDLVDLVVKWADR
ncbi:MAG TPA: uroporphyrinogen-III C-methyltransferase [bacterium]|nr:uroporphyrinogen-III C-methyltransferase [bacterium]